MLAAFLGTLFGLLLAGAWIGAALGITAIVIMEFWGGGVVVLGSAAWSSLSLYSLCALPGFIFMGQIILVSGLAVRIYDSVLPLMARFPGKLLNSNILICAMFAAVLGSSTANAAVVGSVAIPELRKRKYDEKLLLGTICIGGTLGILIPPSNAFILYGVLANTSIAALFAAGTIPGIMMALLFMTCIGIIGKITPNIAPVEEERLSPKATLLSLLRIWPLVILMFACVGTIYIGFCTPVEGAGIGAFAAILMGWIFGNLGWPQIKAALVRTTEITSMLFFLVLGAMLMSVALSSVGVPRAIVLGIAGLPLSAMHIVLLIFLMYLVMGCFVDGISMLVATMPFVVPIITSLGVDPIWFGVALIMVVEIGQVTPPVGLNLFVVQGIGGPGTALADIFLGALPFLMITLAVLGIVSVFPDITTFLPSILGLL
jgi:tripartite ATP-independent transporter DctM subunit